MSAVDPTITVTGDDVDGALRAHVMERLGEALARLSERPITARATFRDENGPKGGPALVCRLDVQVPYQPDLHAEHADTTARRAFDVAMDALDRQLERYRERARDEQRHPKKYFAARRASETGGGE
jgi:ribosomal subunit interface protein